MDNHDDLRSRVIDYMAETSLGDPIRVALETIDDCARDFSIETGASMGEILSMLLWAHHRDIAHLHDNLADQYAQ